MKKPDEDGDDWYTIGIRLMDKQDKSSICRAISWPYGGQTKMKKSYLDELVEWGAENPVKNQSKLAEFLSVKDDVKAALNAGHEISQTWRHMRATGRITISKTQPLCTESA